ncbi:MAG: MMPL family transporter, partial [Halomonadaceae bacterium]
IERAEKQQAEAFESRILLLVSGPESAQKVPELKRALHASGSVAALASDDPARPDAVLAPYRYRLLADSLAEKNADEWQKRGLSRLFTPGVDADLKKDPFGLLDAWLEARLGGPVTLEDGHPGVTHSGTRWQLLSAELAGSPYAMGLQQRLTDALATFEVQHPELEVLRAGLVFHAAASAAQGKREITTIGLGSLLGIVLLLGAVFRRPGVLASLLLTVSAGIAFALPLTWWLFGTLNLLTLAFGASLIGIAVDYALHLQCARQLHPGRPLARLWPGLALGLVSSLAAYLMQLATPLPGLHQMATFAALGLAGAWLTTRLWLPLLPKRPHPATWPVAERLDRLRLPQRTAPWWAGLALVGVAAAVLIATRLAPSDDLRALNPSPPGLVDQQRQVQTLLERPGGQRYLIVTAGGQEALLDKLEHLNAPLDELARAGQLGGYRHLAQSVPPKAVQDDNLARVSDAYRQALPGLLDDAGLPAALLETISAPIEGVPYLTPERWLESPAGAADAALWLSDAATPAALVRLDDATPEATQRLQARTAETPGLYYHDRVATISAQFTRLRQHITRWLGLALAGLAVVFIARYRRRAWRVLLPPVGAVILTLGVFAAAGVGVTLFHLLGLLLVLGIGLDAGIFSTEHPEDPAAWLAISLSCASSLLAFGLLAFSATPALHFLGTTCLAGLTASWLLVPFSRGPRRPVSARKEHVLHG